MLFLPVKFGVVWRSLKFIVGRRRPTVALANLVVSFAAVVIRNSDLVEYLIVST